DNLQFRFHATLDASDMLRAKPSGEGFEFAPKDWVERPVRAGEVAVWSWTVKPTRLGRLPLYVEVEKRETVPGSNERAYQYAAVVKDEITVNVSASGVLREYWKEIAVGLTTVVGALWALFKFFSKRNGAGSPDNPVND